jgi:hypothetical protein
LAKFGYVLSEGVVAITMNGIANFATFFYAQVMGSSAAYTEAHRASPVTAFCLDVPRTA